MLALLSKLVDVSDHRCRLNEIDKFYIRYDVN